MPQPSPTGTQSSDQPLTPSATDLAANQAESNSPDYTIVQNSAADSRFQSAAATTPPPDGTIVQNPEASPSRNASDQTIAQISPQQSPSPVDRDSTLYQPPKAAPAPDATRFQGSPAAPGTASKQPEQVTPTPNSSQPKEVQAPDSVNHSTAQGKSAQNKEDGLLAQAEGWLRSSAANYVDRFRAQAQAELRHGAYRVVARFLPVGVGFAFGLAAISGAYYLFRSKLPNLPFPTKPSPTLFK